MISTALTKQTPANENMLPWNPIVLVNIGKYFITMKANIQMSEKQSEAPKFFNFSGIVSETITNGRLKTAHEPMNTTKEKLTIGIQLYGSTS